MGLGWAGGDVPGAGGPAPVPVRVPSRPVSPPRAGCGLGVSPKAPGAGGSLPAPRPPASLQLRKFGDDPRTSLPASRPPRAGTVIEMARPPHSPPPPRAAASLPRSRGVEGALPPPGTEFWGAEASPARPAAPGRGWEQWVESLAGYGHSRSLPPHPTRVRGLTVTPPPPPNQTPTRGQGAGSTAAHGDCGFCSRECSSCGGGGGQLPQIPPPGSGFPAGRAGWGVLQGAGEQRGAVLRGDTHMGDRGSGGWRGRPLPPQIAAAPRWEENYSFILGGVGGEVMYGRGGGFPDPHLVIE